MKTACLAILATVLSLFLTIETAVAAKRVALVVGNSTYQHAAALKNPINDAEAVAETLERLDFDVVKGVDLSHKDFAKTISKFAQKLSKGVNVALFFYGGHGLQLNGQNYLVPVDAELGSETSLEFEAVRLQTILTLMERSQSTNLVFLDACRDNPLARNLARTMGTRSVSLGRGLARVETGVGTLIAYSTQPGNVALDGDGVHSPFAKAFLKHAEAPGVEIEGLMRKVRQDVISDTNGAQVPWNHSSLTRKFVFNPAKKIAKVEPKKPAPAPAPTQSATSGGTNPVTLQFDSRALDLAFWTAIQDSKNISLFEEYLRRYPEGQFAFVAKVRMEELKAAKKEAKAPPAPPVPAAPVKKKEPEPPQKIAKVDELTRTTPAIPAKPPVDRRTLTISLQRALNRVGCNAGVVDGVWGRNGRTALANFSKYAKVQLPGTDPSEDVLSAVRTKKGKVCPRSCGAGQELKDNLCVAKAVDPATLGSFDGTYLIQATRTKKKNKFACLSTYSMTLVVKGGRAAHKLPFGHLLVARAKGNRLFFSSKREATGGGWSGALTMAPSRGGRTSGYLRWGGDGKICAFRVAVTRR
ncbi:MAG: hypothetical protein GY948_18370 [Alphaproteobacteria bacterium]|nr:hypothetical protein [Alphaproteobacteria bacterium]